jgi:hypothetical protein
MSWSVVVPTNRPEHFLQFMQAWQTLFQKHNVYLIVVQDNQGHYDDLLNEIADYGIEGEVHHWGTIKAKHIPRRTDMVRSWGIYRAWRFGSTYTLTLDDDVRPAGDLFEAYERVFDAGAPCSPYLDVGSLTSYGKPMRGFPFKDREPAKVAVQYGGWHGVLDYDAPTQLAGVSENESFHPVVMPVPRYAPVTGCIMNAAWRTEYAKIMWQLPLYDGKFNRFGDIWAGLFAKKVLDAEGSVMVINGEASVRHGRASNPIANMTREGPGIPLNEDLWGSLVGWPLDGDLEKKYVMATDGAFKFFKAFDHEYALHFRVARDEWVKLFD